MKVGFVFFPKIHQIPVEKFHLSHYKFHIESLKLSRIPLSIEKMNGLGTSGAQNLISFPFSRVSSF